MKLRFPIQPDRRLDIVQFLSMRNDSREDPRTAKYLLPSRLPSASGQAKPFSSRLGLAHELGVPSSTLWRYTREGPLPKHFVTRGNADGGLGRAGIGPSRHRPQLGRFAVPRDREPTPRRRDQDARGEPAAPAYRHPRPDPLLETSSLALICARSSGRWPADLTARLDRTRCQPSLEGQRQRLRPN